MSDFLQFLSEFVLLFLSAVFVENIVFTRGIGLSRAVAMARRPRSIFFYGLLLTALSLLTGLACYGIHALFPTLPTEFQPLTFFAAASAIYGIVYLLLTQTANSMKEDARRYLPVATFNCAVMGGIFLAIQNGYDLWQFIAIGLGNGIGFILATLLLLNADRVLSRTDAPKSFAGFPLMLIYIGILALAFYAFVGHRLPF